MRVTWGKFPWSSPDADILGDIRELMQAGEAEASRSAGGRVPIGVLQRDRVESDTTPGRFYNLWQTADGVWHCDCPGYEHRDECKHVRRKRAAEGAEATG